MSLLCFLLLISEYVKKREWIDIQATNTQGNELIRKQQKPAHSSKVC